MSVSEKVVYCIFIWSFPRYLDLVVSFMNILSCLISSSSHVLHFDFSLHWWEKESTSKCLWIFWEIYSYYGTWLALHSHKKNSPSDWCLSHTEQLKVMKRVKGAHKTKKYDETLRGYGTGWSGVGKEREEKVKRKSVSSDLNAGGDAAAWR